MTNPHQTTLPPTLVPELGVSDIVASRHFYVDVLGFAVKFERPEEGFAYITLDQIREGASLLTAAPEPPLGRGMNLEIAVPAIDPLLERLRGAGHPLWREPREEWYRAGEVEVGVREFLLQDPDGYLLRFAEELGERPAGAN